MSDKETFAEEILEFIEEDGPGFTFKEREKIREMLEKIHEDVIESKEGAIERISAKLEEAYKIIGEAQSIADQYGVIFYFDVGGGMHNRYYGTGTGEYASGDTGYWLYSNC